MIRELRFEMLCRRLCDEIYRYALVILGNRSDAEDITQEALLRLWRNLHNVPFSSARAWTYRTTRNLCLDQIRRATARSAPILVNDEVLSESPDESAPDPRQTADSGFVRERIAAVLLELPEKLRSVLVLYEINGLRYHEISQALEMPLNSVKVTLLRARIKFRELLTREEPWIKNYVD